MSFRLVGFIILLFSVTTISLAQPQNPKIVDPDAVPITGIEYLLVAGGLYGVQRLSRRRNKIKDEG